MQSKKLIFLYQVKEIGKIREVQYTLGKINKRFKVGNISPTFELLFYCHMLYFGTFSRVFFNIHVLYQKKQQQQKMLKFLFYCFIYRYCEIYKYFKV